MKQNQEYRNKLLHCGQLILTRFPRQYNGEKIAVSINVAGSNVHPQPKE